MYDYFRNYLNGNCRDEQQNIVCRVVHKLLEYNKMILLKYLQN